MYHNAVWLKTLESEELTIPLDWPTKWFILNELLDISKAQLCYQQSEIVTMPSQIADKIKNMHT